MKLSRLDEKSYPQFTRYLKANFPKLIHVPAVVSSVGKYGNLNFPEFTSASRYGTLPEIKITDLYHGQCSVPKAYGCFRNARPAFIEIHAQVVLDFEAASASGIDKNANGRAVYVVGATLLHELCHWGNFNNMPPVPELKEMGEAFELATYGKVIY